MIIEMTRIEYAVCELLSDDGYEDSEILRNGKKIKSDIINNYI